MRAVGIRSRAVVTIVQMGATEPWFRPSYTCAADLRRSRLNARSGNNAPRAMNWLYYAILVAVNLAAGYALGRWWLRNRATA